MILNYVSVQATSVNCAVSCSLQDEIEKDWGKKQSDLHKCCDKKTEQEEKKKTNSCMEVVDGICFHKIINNEFISSNKNQVIKKLIYPQQLFTSITNPRINPSHVYGSKIPEHGFLEFKANLYLYILKDQFLI
jgi:hypothetical protein